MKITIETETLRALDAEAAIQGKSRSLLISDAVKTMLLVLKRNELIAAEQMDEELRNG